MPAIREYVLNKPRHCTRCGNKIRWSWGWRVSIDTKSHFVRPRPLLCRQCAHNANMALEIGQEIVSDIMNIVY
jgi:hypothetical protein